MENEEKVENIKTDKSSFYTNMIYFFVVAIFVGLRVCSSYGLFSFMGKYASYYLSLFTQIGLLFLFPFLTYKLLTKNSAKNTLKSFNYKKISRKTIVISVFLGVVVFFLNIYASTFFNSIIQLFGYKSSSSGSLMPATWWALALNLFCTAVLPAVCEETLHRGMLLNGNVKYGMKKSILISGFLFGLLHLNIEQFFYATLIGLFLGYLCCGCNSIYPCMIVHFMNNAISVFLSFAQAKGWAVGSIFVNISKFLISNPIIGFVMFFLVFSLLVLCLMELTKFLFKESFEYIISQQQKELTTFAIRASFFQQVEDIKNNEQPQKNMYAENNNVIFVDARQLLQFFDKKFSSIFNKQSMEENETNKKIKMETKTKIFLVASFVLSAIVTIMTFIWGLL